MSCHKSVFIYKRNFIITIHLYSKCVEMATLIIFDGDLLYTNKIFIYIFALSFKLYTLQIWLSVYDNRQNQGRLVTMGAEHSLGSLACGPGNICIPQTKIDVVRESQLGHFLPKISLCGRRPSIHQRNLWKAGFMRMSGTRDIPRQRVHCDNTRTKANLSYLLLLIWLKRFL